MSAATEHPSELDLSHPLERYSAQGVTVTVLRGYWRRRPALHPSPWPGVDLAYRRDGQFAAVPAKAGPEVLAHYYFAVRVLREAAP